MSAQRFEATETTVNGVRLVAIGGELDISTSPRVRELLSVAAQDADRPLVVDLRGCDFIDSTGLSVLLNAKRRLTRRGRGFAVVCPPGHVHRILEVTQLLEALGCHGSREEALVAIAEA